MDVALSNLTGTGITAIVFDYAKPSYPLASSTSTLEYLNDDSGAYQVKCNKFGPALK